MAALALSIASLGNLLASHSEALRIACGILSAGLVVLVLARVALDSKSVLAECGNPATLAVLPTLFMALMLLAAYLKPYAGTAALGLWVVALLAQLITTGVFIRRYLVSFELGRVLPSWFIVFVGYVVASLTSPAFSLQPVGRVLLYAGLIGYAVTLAVVIYRLAKAGDLPKPAMPTVAIFAAPASLCLAGYLAVSEVKQPAIVYGLLAVSIISLLYVLSRLPGILTLDFHPGFAALTFPMVISGIALKQSSAFLASTSQGSPIPGIAVSAVEVLAIATVLYVLVRYTLFLTAEPARD